MAASSGEIDFSKSTMAYPMGPDAEPVFLQQASPDAVKSTMAYPMYDDAKVAKAVEAAKGVRTVQELTAESTGAFLTPGPVSTGALELVAEQRRDLALSEDPSGESDAGYEARPSTIPRPGADGVDRQSKTVAPAPASQAGLRTRARGK